QSHQMRVCRRAIRLDRTFNKSLPLESIFVLHRDEGNVVIVAQETKMTKTSDRAVTSGFNRFALVVLSVAASACIVTTVRAQGREEEGYSATEETLSAGESSWVVFTAYGQARVTFEYKIESGKAVDI